MTITNSGTLTTATAEAITALKAGDLLTIRHPYARNSRTILISEVDRSGGLIFVRGSYTTRFGLVSGPTSRVFLADSTSYTDLIAVVLAAELETVATYRDGRPLRVVRRQPGGTATGQVG